MGTYPCFCISYKRYENPGEIVIGKGVYKFKKMVFIIYNINNNKNKILL